MLVPIQLFSPPFLPHPALGDSKEAMPAAETAAGGASREMCCIMDFTVQSDTFSSTASHTEEETPHITTHHDSCRVVS